MSIDQFEYVENGVIKTDICAYGRWQIQQRIQQEIWPRVLRELFDGDVEGMQRFQARLRDLDRRFDAWEDADFENWKKVLRWRTRTSLGGVELRP